MIMAKMNLTGRFGISCLVLLFTVLLGLLVGSGVLAAAEKPIVWKMNAWYSPTHSSYRAIQKAIDRITQRSNGRLLIEQYPSFSLGFKPNTWWRDHKNGAIDISMLFDIYTCGEVPYFCAPESDNMFASREKTFKAMDAFFPFKERVIREKWKSEYIAAGTTPSNTACIFSNKPIKSLDDLKGLKIRAPGQRIKETLEALGAAPQFLPRSEVYMAMKTGVLDAFASGYGSIYDEKLHEVFKYAILTGVVPILQCDIVVSNRVWKPLPDDLKKIVREEFKQWSEDVKELTLSRNEDNVDIEKLKKAGRILTEFSPEDMRTIRDTAIKVQDVWAAKEGGLVAEAWAIIRPISIED